RNIMTLVDIFAHMSNIPPLHFVSAASGGELDPKRFNDIRWKNSDARYFEHPQQKPRIIKNSPVTAT
ncbi:MAG: hypothetical protein ABGX16_15170, partial [Pirellulales bacterium]